METSRAYLEPVDFRWFIRNDSKIIANAAVHDKVFLSDGKHIPIAGVALVCVRPEFRGKGLVRQLLAEVHNWAKTKNYPFAFLFGKNEIYRSSGYIQCTNQFKYLNHIENTEEVKPIETARYHPLKNQPWPKSTIDLQGPVF